MIVLQMAADKWMNIFKDLLLTWFQCWDKPSGTHKKFPHTNACFQKINNYGTPHFLGAVKLEARPQAAAGKDAVKSFKEKLSNEPLACSFCAEPRSEATTVRSIHALVENSPLCSMWSRESSIPPSTQPSGGSQKSWVTACVVRTLHS